MSAPQFVHLRVHTAYSLSEGAMLVPKLIHKLHDQGVPAIAVTDTANMFGGKAFSKYASDEGVKPILGCQFYLRNPDADDVLKAKGRIIEPDKIVLLVMNENGYQNIMKLMKRSYLDNPKQGEKAQLKMSDLEELNGGLIALTAGVEGQIGRLLLENRKAEAEEVVVKLREIFADRLYMEISRIGLETEQKTEDDFINFAYKYNIPLVATNEAFFFDADMYEAHDALICIAAGEYVANDDRKKYSPNNRLRSAEEMVELFKDLPEAVQSTVNIAARCNYLSQKVDPLLPIFECPEGKTQDEFITEQAYKGLKQRMEAQVYNDSQTPEERAEIDKRYYERLDYELSVIKKMGFPGYFLIVSDFIQWSKAHGVPVGPGRGSGAGSIVAWSLKITDLDPLKLDLLFERFLNPERVNMPDFDVDFCQENRYKTIEYVQKKYGFDHVAQIITYGKLQAKNVIRDVARVLQMPYAQADRISKMIPPGVQGKNPTLQESLDQVPELEQMRQEDPQINKLFDIGMKLEGLYRQSGMHAAGVVIGDRPLDQLVPLYKDPKADMPVTQYDMKFVEETGLIKFDFLGLKTLTVIKKAVDWVKKVHKIDLDIDNIPLDDKLTYEMLQRGDTSAVFQFESPGMKDVHKQIKPDRFEDLIAIVSLYRPGPMDNIPTYIKRKHGEEEITYLHPDLAPILDETYGIMVYQEQVMKIAQALGGYTMGGADKLRKVMGKKMRDEIPKQRKMFTEGAVAKGIDEGTATKIFDQMEKFASYGFNKSHAAAYSLVSYQTAYLKAHYPAEFMAALLSRNLSDIKKISFFMDECKRMGLSVLGPDVNYSKSRFSVDEDGNVRFGMAAIKGVGEAAVQNIIEVRKEGGKFTSIYDFVERVNLQAVNKKTLENLVLGGAFDTISSFPRSAYLAKDDHDMTMLDALIRYGNRIQNDKNNVQQSLFGETAAESSVQKPEPPQHTPWSKLEMLNREREVIGIYLSSHPLDDFSVIIRHYCNCSLGDLSDLSSMNGRDFMVAGMVTSVMHLTTKTGKPYGRFTIEDYNGSHEFVLFSKEYENFRRYMFEGYYLFIRGKVGPRIYNPSELEAKITSMMMLSEAQETLMKEVTVMVPVNDLTEELIGKLSCTVKDNRGKVMLRVKVYDPAADVAVNLYSKSVKVDMTGDMVRFLEDYALQYTLM